MTISAFADKIYKYCTGRNLLVGVSCIVAGLSGGPDSVALVSSLAELRDNIEGFPKIFAVHINHGLREEASFDEKLSQDLCAALNIPFRAYSFDCKAEASKLGRGLEETGRILRYKAFNDFADEISSVQSIPRSEIKIATAHHLGDLTETFLMNLFRGAGLEGLTAMNSSEGVIRPLLCVTKDEITKYLDENNISYATDITNLQSDYTRNKWRNEILPLISSVSVKDPNEAVEDTYKLLSQDADYLSSEAGKAYGNVLITEGRYKFIKAYELDSLHPAIINRVIRLYWKDVFGNLTDFETVHVDIVNNLMNTGGGTHYAGLPFGRKALYVGGFLGFYGEEGADGISCAMATYMGFPAVPEDIEISLGAKDLKEGVNTLNLPDSALSLEASIVENNESIVYNTCSWICPEDNVVIGTISDERDFQKAGSPHKTDINKLLSDLKIPRDARRHLIAVRSGGRVLWIPGVGHAEGFVSSLSRERWLDEHGSEGKTEFIKLQIVRKEDKGGQV